MDHRQTKDIYRSQGDFDKLLGKQSPDYFEEPLPKAPEPVNNSKPGAVSELTRLASQGVEVTTQQRFLGGLVKISGGVSIDGINTVNLFFTEQSFGATGNKAAGPFDDSQVFYDTRAPGPWPASPISTNSSAPGLGENMQVVGIIEPLTLRPVATFRSTYVEHEPYSVWGRFTGNISEKDWSTLPIVFGDVEVEEPGPHSLFVEDALAWPTLRVESHYINMADGLVKPFNDNPLWQLPSNQVSGPLQDIAYTRNFDYEESYDKFSPVSGFVYDGAGSFRDSVAFGGELYT